MNIEEFKQQLNAWGRDKVPFLFVIDFECQKPFACRLEDAADQNISYDFQGITNTVIPKKQTAITLRKIPIPFSEYQQKFDKVFHHLTYGDSFLTNLTIRTEIKCAQSLLDIFEAASAKYKLLFKDEFLVFSPETFVRISGGKIRTYPMKGTIDASVDDAAKKLTSNAKERAEHITIVDLLRNDLSQVADDVTVTQFQYLETVKTNDKNLLQMSSEIIGTLSENYQTELGDIILKLLPAGSVSGAPKKKTLEIIQGAEGSPRGFYTGVFGYFDGSMLDSGVMIRFIERSGEQLFYRSGGGITAQSDVKAEYQEVLDKIYVPIN